MFRLVVVLLSGLTALSGAQTNWALSGKIVDAEEGNGLNAVEVSLVNAGLRTTTAKNGSWTIVDGVGVGSRTPRSHGTESFLRLVDGRLSLRLDGVDIRGRRMDNAPPPPASAAARSLEEVADTLVFTREGFVEKRIPLSTSSIAGMAETLRRIRYAGWVDSSHSNGFKPDTLNGFLRAPRTLTLRWSKRNWDAMMQAMTDSCGAFGTRGADGATSRPCSESQFDYIQKSALIWVPADIETDGRVWKNVGVRLKGNWSLRTSWTSKDHALPFRINTDMFEDSLPETKNQRFYGFKKISLFNAVQDRSGIRGAVAGSIFRQFGVVAPLSVPVRLVIKFGDTTKDVGAYEMVEIPDSPLLNRHFDNDSGNLYKPESKLDQYLASEWEDEDIPGDRSDAKNLISVINAANRTTDTATWHRNLEAVLDVDGFLRWLAASTVIMNWDAYGIYAHNYYLFNDKGRFRWITFDFGNSFNYTMGSRTSIWYDQPLGLVGVQPVFPLIKNLLADKNYCETYRTYTQKVLAGPANVQNFQSLVDKYGPWISNVPATVPEVSRLRTFMTGRISEVQNSLGNKTCPIR